MAEAPESVRRKSAHVLGITLVILGLLGLGATALEYMVGVAEFSHLALTGVLTALVAIPGGILEYKRDHRGELMAVLAFIAAFMTSALLLVNGFWFYVPVLGATNLIVMILLMWRVAVRSETNVTAQREARQHH